MCQGRDKLEYYLADYKKRADTLSKKEQDTLRDMRIVQEMYARGFDFMPLDIYRAKARDFQIIDGKLMPSLSSIDGLGEKAADAVVDAVKDGPFLSVEDFSSRTRVNGTICALMSDLGLLKDLPSPISFLCLICKKTAVAILFNLCYDTEELFLLKSSFPALRGNA